MEPSVKRWSHFDTGAMQNEVRESEYRVSFFAKFYLIKIQHKELTP